MNTFLWRRHAHADGLLQPRNITVFRSSRRGLRALYNELGDKLAECSRYGLADASVMEQLHLMTGRYASQTLTFPDSAQDAAGKREHFPALIFNYSKQPQSFATVTTRGQPMRRLMYTDDVFLHRFLHYFAADMLGQPRLASTPEAARP